jgi:Cdc6-like AAA superfamily ATPase
MTASRYDINFLLQLLQWYAKHFTGELSSVYTEIMDLLRNERGECFVLNASTGCGKTITSKTIMQYYEQKMLKRSKLSDQKTTQND